MLWKHKVAWKVLIREEALYNPNWNVFIQIRRLKTVHKRPKVLEFITQLSHLRWYPFKESHVHLPHTTYYLPATHLSINQAESSLCQMSHSTVIYFRCVMNCTWSSLTCDGKLLQSRGRSWSIKPGLMNPPVRPLPEQNPAVERPRNSKCISLCVFRVPSPLRSYHFRTKLSQSPRTATQMSLSPVSLRRWNQTGKKKKNVVCRSATVDATLKRSSYLLYLVCRWTASSTPQLWRRSMISRPLPEDAAPNLGYCVLFCPFCSATLRAPLDFTQG